IAVVKPSCCWYICVMYPRWRAVRTYFPGGTTAKTKAPSASVVSVWPASGGLGLFGVFEALMETVARANGWPVIASMTLPLIRKVVGGAAARGEAGGAAAC